MIRNFQYKNKKKEKEKKKRKKTFLLKTKEDIGQGLEDLLLIYGKNKN